MQEEKNIVQLTSKDVTLSAIIGLFFGLFSIPILKNIELPFFEINTITIILIPTFFVVFAVFAIWIASIIGKRISIAFQFAKFGAIGAFNTFFDWGILNILILLTGLATGVPYAVFKGISFSFATGASYFWNKYWAFEDQSEKKISSDEVKRFIFISLIGVIINISLASLVVQLFKTDDAIMAKRLANIGAATATIASLLWNFVGYKLWVFKKGAEAKDTVE